jgi:two-component system heavy metal sensor histidine kinase CusS
LALRLSCWYAGSAFLLLAVATGVLYWALVRSSDHEDDRYLQEKINTLSTLVLQGDFRTVEWEVQGEAAQRPATAMLARVLREDGSVLVETAGMGRQLPPGVFPAGKDSTEVRAANGRLFRLRSGSPPGYVVQVGIEVTHEQRLLADYRRGLWIVLLVGFAASVLMGHYIARRGIRPVQEIAYTVRRIGSATLDRRLDTAGMAAELANLAETFNGMLDRLEDAFGRLARFSSDIAHELRTPVGNLRGEVEVALSKARGPEEYRHVLESALEESLRLSRLIDSLLFLARAENPGMEIRRERLNVAAELAAVRDFYEAASSEAGIALETEAEAVEWPLDRTLFQRAVGNLIENALAHTPAGGSIRVKAGPAADGLTVSVTDTGHGIPPEHLPHVFDRFHRVDPARSQHSGGAGLGLAIVKSIAALHGGFAEISSIAGHGTRVMLVFPEMTKS